MGNKLVFHNTRLERVAGTNTLAYWAHSKVTKKIGLCEFCTQVLNCFIGMEQHILKIVNNYLNANIYSYLETSGGQSPNLYLNVVHFFNTIVN
jgi:hypothetical protein